MDLPWQYTFIKHKHENFKKNSKEMNLEKSLCLHEVSNNGETWMRHENGTVLYLFSPLRRLGASTNYLRSTYRFFNRTCWAINFHQEKKKNSIYFSFKINIISVSSLKALLLKEANTVLKWPRTSSFLKIQNKKQNTCICQNAMQY